MRPAHSPEIGDEVSTAAMVWYHLRVRGAGPGGERGASYVEYAFLVGLIAVVCVAAVTFFGSATSASLDSSASRL
ncbi:MAG: Flp family type IVb pilin [Acidimicrobiales bacterium]